MESYRVKEEAKSRILTQQLCLLRILKSINGTNSIR